MEGVSTISWSPWAIQTDGPPCARGCTNWKPQFKYTPDGRPDGIQCCQAVEQYRDFSCFQPKVKS